MIDDLERFADLLGLQTDLVLAAAVLTVIVWGAVGPAVHARRALPGDPVDGPYTGQRWVRKELQAPLKMALAASLGVLYGLSAGHPPVHGVLAGVAASAFAGALADIIRGVRER